MVTEVSLEKEQSRAAIEVVVMEALRKISVAPRCGGTGGVAPAELAGAVRLRPADPVYRRLRGRSRDRPLAFWGTRPASLAVTLAVTLLAEAVVDPAGSRGVCWDG